MCNKTKILPTAMLASQDKPEKSFGFTVHNYFPENWHRRIKLNMFPSTAKTIKMWTNQYGDSEHLNMCLKSLERTGHGIKLWNLAVKPQTHKSLRNGSF